MSVRFYVLSFLTVIGVLWWLLINQNAILFVFLSQHPNMWVTVIARNTIISLLIHLCTYIYTYMAFSGDVCWMLAWASSLFCDVRLDVIWQMAAPTSQADSKRITGFSVYVCGIYMNKNENPNFGKSTLKFRIHFWLWDIWPSEMPLCLEKFAFITNCIYIKIYSHGS